jgi:hypothetical protein
MRTTRKTAGPRKIRMPIRDELLLVRRQIGQLRSALGELRKSVEDLARSHTMNMRRFGELQFDLDGLKKILER